MRAISWVERVEDLAEVAAAWLMLAGGALLMAGVAMRNVLHASPSWIVELPVYLLVWGVFLALACSFHRGPQMGVDLVVRRLPASVQRLLALLRALAMLAIALALAWLTGTLALQQLALGTVSNTAMRAPLAAVTLAAPIGCLLIALRALADLRPAPAAEQAADPGAATTF